jgi:hypothetical protein
MRKSSSPRRRFYLGLDRSHFFVGVTWKLSEQQAGSEHPDLRHAFAQIRLCNWFSVLPRVPRFKKCQAVENHSNKIIAVAILSRWADTCTCSAIATSNWACEVKDFPA